MKLAARDDLREPPLAELLMLDDAAFRRFFSGSPVKRIGRDRFVRNVLIAAGNSRDGNLIAPCQALLSDASPLVRGAAVWALSRLLTPAAFDGLSAEMKSAESDEDVVGEWMRAARREVAA
jgi:epoxyqueuosine reductase